VTAGTGGWVERAPESSDLATPAGGARNHNGPTPPSVASGLWSTVLLLLGGLIAVGVAAVVSFVIALGQFDDIATRWAPLDRTNHGLRDTAADAQASLRAYLVTGNPMQLRAYNRAQRGFEDEIENALTIVGEDAPIERSLERQRQRFDNWITIVAEPTLADREVDPAAAYGRVTNQESLALANEVDEANADTENRIAIRRATIRKQLDEFVRGMLFVVGLVVVLSLLVALYRTLRLRRLLIDPLRDTRDTLVRLGSGDLDARASNTGFAEVREVAESVNALAEENQRLTARQTRRIERERQGRRLAASLHEHLELGRILSMAGAAIGETLHVDRVVFRLATEAGFDTPVMEWLATGVAPLDEVIARPMPPDHPLVAPVLDGRVCSITGLESDDGAAVDPRTRAFLEAVGSKSVLAVPVQAGDVIVAVVVVHEMVEARRWLPSEIDLVQVMADELGSAIRHAQLYEAERSMVEQLRELDEVKSDFVSSVSHELRTPLTSVMGYLEMLRDREAGPLTPEQDRMLDIVERNTERLLALIEDLLALARIESGRFRVVPAPLELPPLVDEAIDAIRPELAKRQLRLLIDVPPGLPLVLGDGRQLERVLLNLLSNAVKFTPPGGQIRVTLAPRVRSVVLEVADTGLGIPVEEQDKLFTRFFRSTTSQVHSVPGTGLGLMIVKAVVDSHGGSIDVRSAAGTGTAVTVTLPAVPASARLEEVSR
jgi:two-component system, OmpR family, phosphate regulon sensor histidine kinase PhoR